MSANSDRTVDLRNFPGTLAAAKALSVNGEERSCTSLLFHKRTVSCLATCRTR